MNTCTTFETCQNRICVGKICHVCGNPVIYCLNGEVETTDKNGNPIYFHLDCHDYYKESGAEKRDPTVRHRGDC